MSSWSASSAAATLSGLSPDRAKDTSSVGTSSPRQSCGVGDDVGGGDRVDPTAQAPGAAPGASTSPANADVPAPVSTTRRSPSAASGREEGVAATAGERDDPPTCRQTSGCCAISRMVWAAPSTADGAGGGGGHTCSFVVGRVGRRGVGPQDVPDVVEDQRLAAGGRARRRARAAYCAGRCWLSSGSGMATAARLASSRSCAARDLRVGPVVAQPVAVAVAAGRRCSAAAAGVVALPLDGLGEHALLDARPARWDRSSVGHQLVLDRGQAEQRLPQREGQLRADLEDRPVVARRARSAPPAVW